MNREVIDSLWREYVSKLEVNEIQKRNLEALGAELREDLPFLYEINTLSGDKYKPRTSGNTDITFEYDDDLYILRRGNTGIFLPEEKMKRTIIDMISIFEEILPLGTVVDLRREKVGEQLDLSGVEHFRVVIVKRFIGVGRDIYYPYAGALYPLGTVGEDKMISFSSALIEKVIHRGYCDETEEQFVGLMKREIIIGHRKKPASFCSTEELQAARREMEEEQNGRTQ